MATGSEITPLGGTGWKDVTSALLKGSIGSIPVIGSLLAEIVGLIIPNQRIERIESYLNLLGSRINTSDAESLKEKISKPETIDLFEEGATQSVRALTEERKIYIAQIVANGINGDEKSRIEAKRILKLLSQIDDDQIVILTSYLEKYRNDKLWRSKNAVILAPTLAHIGSSQEEIDNETMHELAKSQLNTLGLLRYHFRSIKKGEIPEFDQYTGMMKASYMSLTPLGRLLLIRSGIAMDGDY